MPGPAEERAAGGGSKMSPTQDRGEASGPLGHLMRLGRRFLGAETQQAEEPVVERRASKRIPLALARRRVPRGQQVPGGQAGRRQPARTGPRSGGRRRAGAEGLGPIPQVAGRGGDVHAPGAGRPRPGVEPGACGSQRASHGELLRRRSSRIRRLILYYLHNQPLLEELNSGVLRGTLRLVQLGRARRRSRVPAARCAAGPWSASRRSDVRAVADRASGRDREDDPSAGR